MDEKNMKNYNLLKELAASIKKSDKPTTKQKKIIESAILIFSEKGYANASTAEIARHAGVSEGTIFKHYGTKENLLLSLIIPYLEDFFPSITGDRIHGLFRKDPFFFPEDVTNLLTELVCNNGTLPQGAPTSPILSNMICYRLDKQLINYAAKTDLYTHDMPTILLFHLQAEMP